MNLNSKSLLVLAYVRNFINFSYLVGIIPKLELRSILTRIDSLFARLIALLPMHPSFVTWHLCSIYGIVLSISTFVLHIFSYLHSKQPLVVIEDIVHLFLFLTKYLHKYRHLQSSLVSFCTFHKFVLCYVISQMVISNILCTSLQLITFLNHRVSLIQHFATHIIAYLLLTHSLAK